MWRRRGKKIAELLMNLCANSKYEHNFINFIVTCYSKNLPVSSQWAHSGPTSAMARAS
jgi:hypothetical protein